MVVLVVVLFNNDEDSQSTRPLISLLLVDEFSLKPLLIVDD